MSKAFLTSQMIKLCQQVACVHKLKNLFQITMSTSKIYTFKASQKNRQSNLKTKDTYTCV